MVSSSSLDGIQKPILVCLLKLEENTKKEWIGWLCVWSDLLIVRWSVHSAKGHLLDGTSFVRIIKPIFFIISDGKIKTHIMDITSASIHTDRKGLSSGKWGAEHLRTRIFCQSPNKLASSVDAIAISKIWKHYSLTDCITSSSSSPWLASSGKINDWAKNQIST